jgi:hypothetical protein
MMQWGDQDERLQITRIDRVVQDGEAILTWQWPKDLEYVCIRSYRDPMDGSLPELDPRTFKLYTREEYKVNSGYRARVNYIGLQYYRIYPCMMRDGVLTVLRQANDNNFVQISGGKANIRFSIKYSNRLFSKMKRVDIRLFCEMPVDREALCYVKKQEGYPTSVSDGVVYPFNRDFSAGPNILPPIEINKNEFVKLFFTDGKRYGSVYELIPE